MKKVIISSVLFIFSLTNQLNSQWVPLNGPGYPINSLVSYGAYLFAATTENAGVFRSSNNGDNWVSVGLPYCCIVLGISGQNLYAGVTGTSNSALFKSTDLGNTWTLLNLNDNSDNDLKVVTVNFITSIGNKIYVGRGITNQNMAVLSVSTNEGLTWTNASNGLNMFNVYQLSQQGNNLYLAAPGGIYSSSNYGINWNYFALSAPTAVATINGYIFASDGYSLLNTTNNGLNWNNISPINNTLNGLVTYNQFLFALYYQNIYVTSDFGTTWTSIRDNINGDFGFLYINEPYIYAGTFPNGIVYRRNLNEITSINNIKNNIPDKFSLSQNYPNPFNPSTIISYQLPKSGEVKLIIYDAIGREVKTLVNEQQNAGSYQVEFDGSNFPSGVYFYKLTSSEFNDTKRMV